MREWGKKGVNEELESKNNMPMDTGVYEELYRNIKFKRSKKKYLKAYVAEILKAILIIGTIICVIYSILRLS